MRTHIATAYYFVGRNTVTAGFRHVYDRVTRTFTRRRKFPLAPVSVLSANRA